MGFSGIAVGAAMVSLKSVKYFRSLLISIQSAAHQFGPSVTSILVTFII